jgi:hypothetical protein
MLVVEAIACGYHATSVNTLKTAPDSATSSSRSAPSLRPLVASGIRQVMIFRVEQPYSSTVETRETARS